jgi:hypothetical protein
MHNGPGFESLARVGRWCTYRASELDGVQADNRQSAICEGRENGLEEQVHVPIHALESIHQFSQRPFSYATQSHIARNGQQLLLDAIADPIVIVAAINEFLELAFRPLFPNKFTLRH